MIRLSSQSLLLFGFGFGLFFLWRAAAPSQRWLKWIVAAGFLSRAVLGQSLFWISWTHLPVLRSLQTDGGYWLFAQDSTFYFPQAVALSEKGLRAIVFYDRGGSSVSYIQVLAGMIALIGRLTSVGILLNLFCYLGTVALLVRWSRARPETRKSAAVAVAAISLSPSLVLWSLQPLKDSLFQFLFVAFVTTCATWQRAWLADVAWRTRFAAGALLAGVLFLMGGTRWYFAGALLAATALFLFVVAFTTAGRKRISLGAAAMMIVILTESLVVSAGPYILPPLVAMFTLRNSGHLSIFAAIEQARRGFDASPARTMIRSGRSLSTSERASRSATATFIEPVPPPPIPPPSVPGPVPPRQFTEADATRIRALLDQQTAAWDRKDVARAMDLYWRSPELEIVEGTKIIHGWEQAAEEHGRASRKVSNSRVTALRLIGAGDTASLSGRWDVTTAAGEAQTNLFTMTMRRFPNGEWKIVREVFPSPPVTLAGATSSRVDSPHERLIAGAAALVIPQTLGERLGLFNIGGGRGLLWFTEVDTLIFDLALILAVWSVSGARAARAWRSALMWLVLLTTLIVVTPLVYSVSNFGTLFRLREMIYLGLLLIPVGASSDGTLAE